jgi:tRNA(Ile)-lysidine synthase
MNLLFLWMPENFLSHLADAYSFLKEKKLLLATSGGIDSMVMVDLFQKLKTDISIAHCNFQLRGNESDGDQMFIESFAQKNNIPYFITRFDTAKFAQDFKLSTQMAARELRYQWFYELAEKGSFDCILTAHHADDNFETFLINLSRGTGIEGLTGIPKQNDKIIRPMLDFSRSAIEAYANQNKLEWREDSSNASDKYLRNKIRHDVVPVLKELNPEFLSAFQKTQNYLQQTQAMAEDAAILVYQQVAQQANDEIHFNLKKLQKLPNYQSYLYHWLHEFGFTAWSDIYDLAQSQSGKQVLAPQYRLVRNRDFLILSQLQQNNLTESFQIESSQPEVNFPINLSICKVNDISDVSNNTIFVDAQKIHFPLTLRRWNEGDVFEPFGMNGRSKKVSKFFKDEKFSIIEKDKTWLLCSNGKIVWIVGSRADERFKVQATTNQILKITTTQ